MGIHEGLPVNMGQMREWPTDWLGGPGEAQNVTLHLQFLTKAKIVTHSASRWSKLSRNHRHVGQIVTKSPSRVGQSPDM